MRLNAVLRCCLPCPHNTPPQEPTKPSATWNKVTRGITWLTKCTTDLSSLKRYPYTCFIVFFWLVWVGLLDWEGHTSLIKRETMMTIPVITLSSTKRCPVNLAWLCHTGQWHCPLVWTQRHLCGSKDRYHINIYTCWMWERVPYWCQMEWNSRTLKKWIF